MSYDDRRPRAAALSPEETVTGLGDAWAEVRRGDGGVVRFLDTARALLAAGPPSADFVGLLTNRLAFIADELVPTGERQGFRRVVAELLRPAWRRVGLDPQPGETDAVRLRRAALVEALGTVARDPALLADVEQRLPACLDGAGPRERELTAAIVRVGAQGGAESRYDVYVRSLAEATSAVRRTELLDALVRFDAASLLHRTFAIALAPPTASSDALRIFRAALAGSSAERRTAWDFFRRHFDTIIGKLPRSGYDALIQAAGSFCDGADRRSVATFFGSASHRTRAEIPEVRSTETEISLCDHLAGRERPRLAAYLRAHPSSGPSPARQPVGRP